MLKNYDGVLKVDGEVGNKKLYDPRAWGKVAETAMAARVVEAATQLGSAGQCDPLTPSLVPVALRRRYPEPHAQLVAVIQHQVVNRGLQGQVVRREQHHPLALRQVQPHAEADGDTPVGAVAKLDRPGCPAPALHCRGQP